MHTKVFIVLFIGLATAINSFCQNDMAEDSAIIVKYEFTNNRTGVYDYYWVITDPVSMEFQQLYMPTSGHLIEGDGFFYDYGCFSSYNGVEKPTLMSLIEEENDVSGWCALLAMVEEKQVPIIRIKKRWQRINIDGVYGIEDLRRHPETIVVSITPIRGTLFQGAITHYNRSTQIRDTVGRAIIPASTPVYDPSVLERFDVSRLMSVAAGFYFSTNIDAENTSLNTTSAVVVDASRKHENLYVGSLHSAVLLTIEKGNEKEYFLMPTTVLDTDDYFPAYRVNREGLPNEILCRGKVLQKISVRNASAFSYENRRITVRGTPVNGDFTVGENGFVTISEIQLSQDRMPDWFYYYNYSFLPMCY